MFSDGSRRTSIDALLLNKVWPQLRDVRFSGALCRPKTAVRFFEAHPNIENLLVDHRFGADVGLYPPPQRLPFSYRTLPNLIRLSSCLEHFDSLAASNPGSFLKLKFLGGVSLRKEQTTNFFAIISCLPALTSLEVHLQIWTWTSTKPDPSLEFCSQLRNAAPSLEYLRIGPNFRAKAHGSMASLFECKLWNTSRLTQRLLEFHTYDFVVP